MTSSSDKPSARLVGAEQEHRLIFPPEYNRKKVFVLDSNVLMLFEGSLFGFADNIAIVPLIVTQEIDHIKNGNSVNSDKKYAARSAVRDILSLRNFGSLEAGVTLPNGGVIYVVRNGYDWDDLPEGLDRSNDNMIILTALSLQKNNPDMEVILISHDANVCITADTLGVRAEEYKGGRAFQSLDEMYTGRANLILSKDFDVQDFFTQQDRPSIILTEDDFEGTSVLDSLTVNQCCFISSAEMGEYITPMVYKGDGEFVFVHREKWPSGKKYKHIVPRNDEQALALHLLMDPSIDIVSIDGDAGSGKTLVALLGALEQYVKYPGVKVYRAAIEADETLGFAPGTREEKFAPWTLPITDQLSVILGERFPASDDDSHSKGWMDPVHEFTEKGIVTIEPPNHIRGRTLSNVFIVIDEAQNLTKGMMKMVITRLGNNAKIVVVGDRGQIDRKGLDAMSNGHAHLVAAFRGQDNFGHITLFETVRSHVAAQGAQLL